MSSSSSSSSSPSSPSSPPPSQPVPPSSSGGPPPLEVTPHLLTWWFGLLAIGGVGFGAVAAEHPFGRGVLGHPLVLFLALAGVVLLTLRFLYDRPLPEFLSYAAIGLGLAIGIGCYFIGDWFGATLMHMP
jgi:hypothetical protein